MVGVVTTPWVQQNKILYKLLEFIIFDVPNILLYTQYQAMTSNISWLDER